MTTDALAAAPAVDEKASWIERVWQELKRLYLFLMPLRFSFLALLAVAIAFLLSAQGYDIIAHMAEDDPTGADPANTGQRIGYLLGVIFMAIQIWYWSRQMLFVKPTKGSPHSSEFPWLTTWLPRILGALTFVIAIGSLYRVAKNYGVPEPVAVLRFMAIELVVAMILFLAFTVIRRRVLKTSVTEEKDFKDRNKSTKIIIVGTLVVSFLFFLWATLFVQSTVLIGSAAIVYVAFGVVVPVGSVIVWLGIAGGVPVLTFLVVWAFAISPLADNHVLKTIPADVMTRPSVATAFDSWFERLQSQVPPGPDGRYPVILVATEGGGIRAAYWTAAVLTSLTDTVPTFSDHVFAISAVSGGALGTGVYGGLLVQREAGKPLRPQAREILSQDALTPTLAAMTQPDFAQRFIPVAFLPDRARALEGGWDRAWQTTTSTDLFSKGFVAMLRGKERTLPSLFFNGTVVETGQRIITSNLRVVGMEGQHPELAQAIDFFDAAGADVSVSTAANNSARFTYVAPAGTMLRSKNTGGSTMNCTPGARCEHVVDGGYFENSGSATASDILDTINHSKYAARMRPYVIFIHFTLATPPPINSEKVGNEVLSPVRALLNVRGAHATLAADELKRRMRPENTTTFLLTQKKAVFPLGWLLADRTRNLMDLQMGPNSPENGANVARIAALLGQTAIGRDLVQEKAAEGEAKPKI